MGTHTHNTDSTDLTEAEDIKKRGKNKKNCSKKDIKDSDNHDGVGIHLEPDILVCEVKWAFSSAQFSCSVMSNSWQPDGLQPRQASLSITNSWYILKLLSIDSVMPSKHLILDCPLLPPSILHNLRGFSYESVLCNRCPNYWSFSFPGDSDSKASAYNVGYLGSVPVLERSSGEVNDNPLQDSFLENPMEGGVW